MPKKDDSVVQSPGLDWSLDYRAVRVHDSHVSGGVRSSNQCPLCLEGLAGAMAPLQEKSAGYLEDGVAEGDGADEGGGPASPRGDRERSSRYEDAVLAGKPLRDQPVPRETEPLLMPRASREQGVVRGDRR